MLHRGDLDEKVDLLLSLLFIFWVDDCGDGTLVDGVVSLQKKKKKDDECLDNF